MASRYPGALDGEGDLTLPDDPTGADLEQAVRALQRKVGVGDGTFPNVEGHALISVGGGASSWQEQSGGDGGGGDTGLTDEQVRDIVGALLVAGSNVTIDVNDAANRITISSDDTVLSAEEVYDTIQSMFVEGSNVTLAKNDTNNTITISSTGGGGTGLDAEGVRDTIGTAMREGTGIAITVSDSGDTITVALADERYTTAEKTKLAGIQEGAQANVGETYSSIEKQKLAGIEAGAEVNVHADWAITTDTNDGFIRNKPTIPTVPARAGAFTQADEDKLDGIEAGAQVNPTDAQIGDKAFSNPPGDLTDPEKVAVRNAIGAGTGDSGGGGEENVQANWDETSTTSDAYIRNKPTLADVATSGDYEDLTNKPVIPTVPDRAGAFTAADEAKLDGIAAGAEVNPTDAQIGDAAFSNPPSDLSDSEKLAARTAIGAGTSSTPGQALSYVAPETVTLVNSTVPAQASGGVEAGIHDATSATIIKTWSSSDVTVAAGQYEVVLTTGATLADSAYRATPFMRLTTNSGSTELARSTNIYLRGDENPKDFTLKASLNITADTVIRFEFEQQQYDDGSGVGDGIGNAITLTSPKVTFYVTGGVKGDTGPKGDKGDDGDDGADGVDGSTTFLGLTDTPAAFGTTGQLAAVNAAGSALEFIDAPTSGEDNVQSDWTETDNTAAAFIQNKPTIPAAPATWAQASGASGTVPDARIPDAITRDSELSTVATSGAYNDLSGKPTVLSQEEVYDLVASSVQAGTGLERVVDDAGNTVTLSVTEEGSSTATVKSYAVETFNDDSAGYTGRSWAYHPGGSFRNGMRVPRAGKIVAIAVAGTATLATNGRTFEFGIFKDPSANYDPSNSATSPDVAFGVSLSAGNVELTGLHTFVSPLSVAAGDRIAVDYINQRDGSTLQSTLDAVAYSTVTLLFEFEESVVIRGDAGGEDNVQADWTQTDQNQDSFIRNKPALADVATSGDYDDLTDKPTIPTLPTDEQIGDKAFSNPPSDLSSTEQSAVRTAIGAGTSDFDGAYSSLSGRPTIPTVPDRAGAFTAADEAKLDGIEAGAQVNPSDSDIGDKAFSNPPSDLSDDEKAAARTAIGAGTSDSTGEDNVQADWSVTDDTSDAFIKNKPTIPTVPDRAGAFTAADEAKLDGIETGAQVNVGSEFTADEKTKLGGIETGAEVNVQADWTATDASLDSYILNKPTIPTLPSDADIGDKAFSNPPSDLSDGEKQAVRDAIDAGTGGGGLSAVVSDATLTGSGTGSDPLVVANPFTDADETKLDGIETGAQVNVGSEFTADEKTKLSGIEAGAEVNVQPNWAATNDTHDAFIRNKPTLADVATSGAYGDLTGTPTIPTLPTDAEIGQKALENPYNSLTDTQKTAYRAAINAAAVGEGGGGGGMATGTIQVPMLVFGEESGGAGERSWSWNFGNGYNGRDNGLTMPLDGRVKSVTTAFVLDTAGTSTYEIGLFINPTVDYNGTTGLPDASVITTTPTSGAVTSVVEAIDLTTPLELDRGDRLQIDVINSWNTNPADTTTPSQTGVHPRGTILVLIEVDVPVSMVPAPPDAGTAAVLYGLQVDTDGTLSWVEVEGGLGEANVQADWNVTDDTDDAFIKNKPTIPTVPARAGAFTAADETKLDGIEAGATADQTGAEIVSAIDTQLGGSTWQSGGGEGGATDLSISRNSVQVIVQSSTGTDATINSASSANAGVMPASAKSKLDGIQELAQRNPTDAEIGDKAFSNPPSDLSAGEQQAVRDAIGAGSGGGGLSAVVSDATLTGSGTGADVLSVANPFTDADETKLDGIEAGAQVNVGEEYTTAEKTKLDGITAGAEPVNVFRGISTLNQWLSIRDTLPINVIQVSANISGLEGLTVFDLSTGTELSAAGANEVFLYDKDGDHWYRLPEGGGGVSLTDAEIGEKAFDNVPQDLTANEKAGIRVDLGLTLAYIGDTAFSYPPSDLTDPEKLAVRNAIDVESWAAEDGPDIPVNRIAGGRLTPVTVRTAWSTSTVFTANTFTGASSSSGVTGSRVVIADVTGGGDQQHFGVWIATPNAEDVRDIDLNNSSLLDVDFSGVTAYALTVNGEAGIAYVNPDRVATAVYAGSTILVTLEAASIDDLIDQRIHDIVRQSDWDETDPTEESFIRNKPDLSMVGGGEENVQADWTETDTGDDAFIQNKPNLATVATSGSYNDLTNRPTIPGAEFVRDTMGTALVGGTNVTITPNDAADTITIAAAGGGLSAEEVNDRIGAVVQAGNGLSKVIDDAGNTVTLALNSGANSITIKDHALETWGYDGAGGYGAARLPDNWYLAGNRGLVDSDEYQLIAPRSGKIRLISGVLGILHSNDDPPPTSTATLIVTRERAGSAIVSGTLSVPNVPLDAQATAFHGALSSEVTFQAGDRIAARLNEATPPSEVTFGDTNFYLSGGIITTLIEFEDTYSIIGNREPTAYWWMQGQTTRWPDLSQTTLPYNATRGTNNRYRMRWGQTAPREDYDGFASGVSNNIWIATGSVDSNIDNPSPGDSHQVFTLPPGRYNIEAQLAYGHPQVNNPLDVALRKVTTGVDDIVLAQQFGRQFSDYSKSTVDLEARDIVLDGTEQLYIDCHAPTDATDFGGYLSITKKA